MTCSTSWVTTTPRPHFSFKLLESTTTLSSLSSFPTVPTSRKLVEYVRQCVWASNINLSPVLLFSFDGSDSHRGFREGRGHIWYVWLVAQPSVSHTSSKVSTPGWGEAAHHWRAVQVEAEQYRCHRAISGVVTVVGHGSCYLQHEGKTGGILSQLSQQQQRKEKKKRGDSLLMDRVETPKFFSVWSHVLFTLWLSALWCTMNPNHSALLGFVVQSERKLNFSHFDQNKIITVPWIWIMF